MGTAMAAWLDSAMKGISGTAFSTAFLVSVGVRVLGILAILVGVQFALRISNALIERAFALDRLARRYVPGPGRAAGGGGVSGGGGGVGAGAGTGAGGRAEPGEGIARRQKTLMALAKSVVRYTLYFVAGVMILQQFGLNTASILAAAGIGGLAVGFGAQNLVKDVIGGFFIIFEDQFAVGDEVTLGKYNGIVEETGIRSTRVRGFGGELFIIPNGQIAEVTNYTGGPMRVMFDVAIAYEADVEKVLRVLTDVCREAAQAIPGIVEGPQVLGVQELADSSVTMRIFARAANQERWAVERALKLAIKKRLDEESIEIPYPHRAVIIRNQPPGAEGLKT